MAYILLLSFSSSLSEDLYFITAASDAVFLVIGHNKSNITAFYLNGSKLHNTLPISNVRSVYGVEVDSETNTVFWTDPKNNTISSAQMNVS